MVFYGSKLPWFAKLFFGNWIFTAMYTNLFLFLAKRRLKRVRRLFYNVSKKLSFCCAHLKAGLLAVFNIFGSFQMLFSDFWSEFKKRCLKTAAVSCSLDVYWLGGVGLGSGTTGMDGTFSMFVDINGFIKYIFGSNVEELASLRKIKNYQAI